ncbi:ABC transporter ATP-binding protein [Peptostreptococcus faecalis]|uniref:ABC transporter ATP-binding protein n=1 Tax=Peptostreptococcus faecalis TaxID=2045015 RepID=UPI001FA882C2|nr:ABC transporter ATP-binding protein [Peptostreptococcus faecalis]
MMEKKYIELENVSKTIKNKKVLNNISLTLKKGKIYGLVGINGSGKTMLLRALGGLISIDGKIFINRKRLFFNKELPETIGIIIENTNWIQNYTGYENLKYLADIKKNIDQDKINEYLKLFELYDKKDLKVKKYSLGMKQKLAIIQAIMEDQNLLLLDEPTNGIDEKSEKIFKETMLNLSKKGKTIIIATHNKDLIKDISYKTIKISDGKINEKVED